MLWHMSRSIGANQYEFHLRGELSDAVLIAFPELQPSRRRGETVLAGEIADQAALFGVLGRIESLGIQLIEVRRTRLDGPPA